MGGLDPRLPLDPDRNSAPCELPREEDVRLPTAGATTGKFPTMSPPELDETVIVGVVVASLVDDMRLAYTAAITSILPNVIVGIGKIEFLPRWVSMDLLKELKPTKYVQWTFDIRLQNYSIVSRTRRTVY